MSKIKRLWREPLVHFLLIGAALFLLFNFMNGPAGDEPNRIVVTPGQVEQLTVQFSRTWLRPPNEDELAGLIEGHVRDEVYYREALTLGLDRNDPQVRQRMRMKLEFLLEDLTAEEAPGDEALAAYLQQHADDFRVEPQVSFVQLYLKPDKRRDLAGAGRKMLASLNAGTDPETLGDPTMVQREYTLATQSDIARSFGEAFARQVVDLKSGEWTGPLYSGLGGHLVMVSERRDGHLPVLAEIRARVERDYLVQRRKALKDIAYKKLREGYEVAIEATTSGSTAGNAMAAAQAEEVRQ